MKEKTSSPWLSRAVGLLCAFVLACGLMGLAGCAQQNAEQAQEPAQEQQGGDESAMRTFTDSLGREVQLPAKVDAIAASGPLAQQVLLTVAPDKMVGLATKLSADQEKYLGSSYADLPVFGQVYGGKGDFNKEAVAAAAPQVVIDVGEAKDGIEEDLDTLQEQLGIPVVHIASSLDSYDEAYTKLGELLGDDSRAKEIAAYCAKVYDETKKAVDGIAEADRPTILYLLGDAGQNVMAKGSFQAGVVDMVANNVAVVEKASGSGTGNESSLEQIANWNPQMIVFAPQSVYDSVASDPAWATLDAVASGNYYEVPGAPYNWLSGPPSVNQLMGMQWLAHLCYPDAFDSSMQDVVTDYYETMYDYDLSQSEYDALVEKAVKK